jgi:glycosyltransferase involved in cell wall biosynthesis
MISFVIPTFNESTAIEKTITSLQALTVLHEIIVSDQSSLDDTVSKAQVLGVNVVILPKEAAHNSAGNRNNGAKYATGEYLVFVDCDAIIPDINTFFIKALKDFEEKQIGALGAWVMTQKDLETAADYFILSAFNYLFLVMNNVLGIGAAVGKFQMFNRETFLKINGYNEHLVANEDHDIFRRISKISKVFMDKDLFVYHSNRRAHSIGWPALLWIWTKDSLSVIFRGTSVSKTWNPIR